MLLRGHPPSRLRFVADELRLLLSVAFVLGCNVRQLGFTPDTESCF